MSNIRKEVDMMIDQLTEATGSVVQKHGMCLSGIGAHNDFVSMRHMHLWLSGAIAAIDWQRYTNDDKKGT